MGTIVAPSSFRNALCADFNGTDEYAYRDNPSFKGDTQGCFAFWYRPTTVLSTLGFRDVISMGVRDAGNNATFSIRQRHNASLTINATYRNQPILDTGLRPTNGGTNNLVYADHILSAGVTGLWVVQSNGSATQHAWNGTLLTSTAWNSTSNVGDWLGDISGSDHRLTLGCQFINNGATMFSGHRMNEVLYFNRPLTSGEITWLYNAGVPRNPHRDPALWSACRLWLRCGDSRDNGTTLYDESGYGNDFTLVNMDGSNYVAP